MTFSSAVATALPDGSPPALTTGTYRPANYEAGADTFPVPGPGALTGEAADLSVFNLKNPNGVWSLYVVDDAGTDVGSIAGGWSLLLTQPTVFTVNSPDDTTDGTCNAANCTLREAIAAAQNDDLIVFSPLFNTPQTINLMTALPDIDNSVTIQGPGANLLTVRRDYNAPDFRIFNIPGGVAGGVAISGMTISNGRTPFVDGGGIRSFSNLTLTNVHVTGNQANDGGGVHLRDASGVFTGCTFSGNTANSSGGGIYYRGDGGRTLRLVNSTVSSNQAGGIIHVSSSGNSSLEVTGSTIANNTEGNSGIRTFANGAGNTATTTLRNTIIAGNTPTNLSTAGGGSATFTTNGFNLSDNFTGGGFTPLGNDIESATPRLGALSLGGGTTPTHALLGGSPAIDKGNASGLSLDQRGVARVFDTTGIPNVSDGADIGAVEMQSLIVTSTANGGTGSLRNTLSNADANPSLTDIIFDHAVFNTPQTISLTGGELSINSNLTINGPGANLLTVRRDNAAANFRIFNIPNGGLNVAISGMTVTGGRTTGANGGGIRSLSNLTLTGVHVTGNQASDNGGGVAVAEGVFTSCTFSDNTANLNGGGILYQSDGNHTLRLVNSTVSGNTATIDGGGGISSIILNGTSRLEVTSSTIANNNAAAGGGIFTFAQGAGTTATTTLRNTILANNTPTNLVAGTFSGGAARVTTHGFNLASDNGGGFLNVAPITTDKINANAGLAPLGDNFGATPTRALLPGSEALDAGNNSGSGTLTDGRGRGFRRTVDLPVANAAGGDGTDIGAFEAQTAPMPPSNCPNPTLTIAEDQNTSPGGLLQFTVTPQAGSVIVDHVNCCSGLQSLTATAVTNATVNIPPFTPGTTAPVFTTFTTTNPAQPTDFTLRAANSTQGILIRAQCSPPPTISINDVSQNETNAGTTNFNFTVNLSAPRTQTVTVSYATADGTATAGSDYTAIATTLTFAPGVTSQQVSVAVNGDTTVEPNETFFVNLSNPTNATLADNQGQGTIVNDDATPTAGLQYYALPAPVRLLDTRTGEPACDTPGAPLTGGASRTQPARTPCSGIPANALAIVGNATVVNTVSGSSGGFITLYPSGAAQPTVSNLNYVAGQVVPNSFTVGLGSTGAFDIFALTTTHFIVDVTGYYAPQTGGLYYHPLPNPVRLLDTRSNEPACGDMPGAPLTGGASRTQPARTTCNGIVIPMDALAIVGNATVVNTTTAAAAGFITLYPSDASRPTVSNLNYVAGQVVPNSFTVGLGADGAFNIFAQTATHFIVDVAGYYSTQQTDINGTGLLYFPLAAPVRLLDTRNGEPACDMPGVPLTGGSSRTEVARGTCSGQTIPAAAQAVIGNATVVNNVSGSSSGFVTLYPSSAALPTVSNLNYVPGQVVPNSFVVGVGNADRAFNIYASSSINFIVDLTGYFAP